MTVGHDVELARLDSLGSHVRVEMHSPTEGAVNGALFEYNSKRSPAKAHQLHKIIILPPLIPEL
jgi:hypothetical protein